MRINFRPLFLVLTSHTVDRPVFHFHTIAKYFHILTHNGKRSSKFLPVKVLIKSNHFRRLLRHKHLYAPSCLSSGIAMPLCYSVAHLLLPFDIDCMQSTHLFSFMIFEDAKTQLNRCRHENLKSFSLQLNQMTFSHSK